MGKLRIDALLVERGLAESRSQAQRLVMAGQVRVNGQIASKPSNQYSNDADVAVLELPRYVSRGGTKLEAALDAFGLEVTGRVCADVGASTGGFTDCLLQHGAAKVFAIDVGKGILHWKLRQDPRVVVLEETNARNLGLLPEPPELITIDASFISLKLLLPVVMAWFPDRHGEIIGLIKPQFEAGKSVTARGAGVIKDPTIHRQVIREVLSSAEELGFSVQGLIRSPLLGPKGNVEFLAHMVLPGNLGPELNGLIDLVIREN